MKKYLSLVVLLLFMNLSHQVIADEVKDKTDGSFVGSNPPKPINSSFVGDISNSMVDDAYGQEDIKKKTDTAFVGTNEIKQDNSLFTGRDFDQQVKEQTDAAFAGERSKDKDSYGK